MDSNHRATLGRSDLQSDAFDQLGHTHMEEAVGFQPTMLVLGDMSVFKTDAIKHSATLPNWRRVRDFNPWCSDTETHPFSRRAQ